MSKEWDNYCQQESEGEIKYGWQDNSSCSVFVLCIIFLD